MCAQRLPFSAKALDRPLILLRPHEEQFLFYPHNHVSVKDDCAMNSVFAKHGYRDKIGAVPFMGIC